MTATVRVDNPEGNNRDVIIAVIDPNQTFVSPESHEHYEVKPGGSYQPAIHGNRAVLICVCEVNRKEKTTDEG